MNKGFIVPDAIYEQLKHIEGAHFNSVDSLYDTSTQGLGDLMNAMLKADYSLYQVNDWVEENLGKLGRVAQGKLHCVHEPSHTYLYSYDSELFFAEISGWEPNHSWDFRNATPVYVGDVDWIIKSNHFQNYHFETVSEELAQELGEKIMNKKRKECRVRDEADEKKLGFKPSYTGIII